MNKYWNWDGNNGSHKLIFWIFFIDCFFNSDVINKLLKLIYATHYGQQDNEKVKHKLRAASYKFLYTNYEFRFTGSASRVASSNLRVTSSNPEVTS